MNRVIQYHGFRGRRAERKDLCGSFGIIKTQIVLILTEYDAGTSYVELGRKRSVRASTAATSKSKFSDMDASVFVRLKAVEETLRGPQRGRFPQTLKCDNSSECTREQMLEWVAVAKTAKHLIESGKPTSGSVENVNSALRDELLKEHAFPMIFHARRAIEARRIDYNLRRPHTSLDGLRSIEVTKQNGSTVKQAIRGGLVIWDDVLMSTI